MEFRIFSTLVFLSSLLYCYQAQKTTEDILNGLVGYDRRMPPQDHSDSPVDILVTMYFLDVTKVDDIKEQLTTQMYLRQKWKDPRLIYESKNEKERLLNYEDLNTRIWTPDLFFVDEQHSKLNTIVFPNSFVRWSPGGKVFMSMRITLTTRCNMDLRYYPHDTQTCTFQIESYAHTANTVHLNWDESKHQAVGFTDSIHDQNFVISEVKSTTELVSLGSGNYSRLLVEVTFERKIGFFMTKLYIPYIVLSIVSWLSMWINPKFVHLRLSLLLSVLSIMFLIAFDMNTFIPRVTYTKAIDVWIAFCISFVFALFLEFIFITQKSKGKPVGDPVEVTTDASLMGKDEKDAKDFLPTRFKFLRGSFYTGSHSSRSRVEEISRFIFPLLFGLFNLAYWTAYAT